MARHRADEQGRFLTTTLVHGVAAAVLATALAHCSTDSSKPKPPTVATTSGSSNAAPKPADTKGNATPKTESKHASGASQSSPSSSAAGAALKTADVKPVEVKPGAVNPADVKPVTATAAAPTYSLVGLQSMRCIDATAAGLTTDGTTTVLYDCTLGSPQQGWTQTSLGQLRLVGSNRCLDTAGADTTQSVPAVTAVCADIPSQKWDVLATAGVAGPVKLRGTDLCLDVANAKVDNNSMVHTSACKAIDNQQWRLGGA